MHAISELRKLAVRRLFLSTITLVILYFMGFLLAREFAAQEVTDWGSFWFLIGFIGVTMINTAISIRHLDKQMRIVISRETDRFIPKLREAASVYDGTNTVPYRHPYLRKLLGQCIDAINSGIPPNQVNAMLGTVCPGWRFEWRVTTKNIVSYTLRGNEDKVLTDIAIWGYK